MTGVAIDSGAVATVSAMETAHARSDPGARLRTCVGAHLTAVWRVLRRNGVPAADADDAAQKVFLVLLRKMDRVPPGRELPFLLRTAVFVASEARRTHRRRREVEGPSLEAHPSDRPGPEHRLLERERLSQLDAILSEIDEPLRVAFILYELEEMTLAAIAETLEMPVATVASRLRRARQRFEDLAEVFRERGGGQR